MQITLQNVRKSYGLKDISLSISPGECIGVVGINGAGKSTFLNCLAGIVGPDIGKILFDEQPFDRSNLELRRRILMIPDSPIYDSSQNFLSLCKDYAFAYQIKMSQLKEPVAELLKLFDVGQYMYHPLGNLSRGHAYKLSLIPLLAIRPELWLLDEPFASGMDVLGMRTLQDQFRSATADGRSIVFTTQILELAEKIANRLVILHQGKVVAAGTMNELRSQSRSSGDLQDIVQLLVAESA
ncbi:MAG: ABC transporter ATP-binding protein [Pirellulales bacterium]